MGARGVAIVGAAAAAIAAYEQRVKPWQESWGASDEELAMVLPGDEHLAEPADQTTRAITIDAPREAVWPWLVQMGADRAGFYTYDALENAFGLGIHSADDIVEGWQDLAVGDIVYGDRRRTGGWIVVELRPAESLVMMVANLEQGRPLRRDEQLGWEFLWNFALLDTPDGATRLVVRERVAFDSTRTRLAMAPVGLTSFVMTRGMLRGIKARVESHRPQVIDLRKLRAALVPVP
ncbi:MAG: SRPBCC family protein [Acidimicrobiales bacterium]